MTKARLEDHHPIKVVKPDFHVKVGCLVTIKHLRSAQSSPSWVLTRSHAFKVNGKTVADHTLYKPP
jgi:hypothetical protein